MTPKKASINQIFGIGLARVSTDPRGRKECNGVFTADSLVEAMSLMDAEESTYSGVVYDGARESILSFPIIITRTQGEEIRFSATGNPYEGNA